MNQTVAAAPSEVKQRAVKRSRVGQLWLDIKKHKISFLFLAPFLILFTTFTIIPVAISFVQSFMYYNIVEKPRWIGWSNFKLLFVDDEVFLKAIANTLKFALVTGPIGYILAFLLAWLISQIPVKYRFFYTLCFYTPAITSGVAISVIWLYLFSGDRYGLINYWAIKLGIINEPWLWLSERQNDDACSDNRYVMVKHGDWVPGFPCRFAKRLSGICTKPERLTAFVIDGRNCGILRCRPLNRSYCLGLSCKL